MGLKHNFLIFSVLVLFPPTFLSTNFAEESKEIKFGYFTDRAITSSFPVVYNERLNNRITEIGNRLAKASDRPEMKYTFRVLNDSTVNAISAAGGFVYLYTGQLDVLESEDELAFIIAHEIVHTSKSHQVKFVYDQQAKKVAGYILGGILSLGLGYAGSMAVSPQYTSTIASIYDFSNMIGGSLGQATALYMIQGYGKRQELEADSLAVHYMKKAGYDPNAAIRVFKRLISIRDSLKISKQNNLSAFINAEPGLEERMKTVEEMILNPNKSYDIKEK